jgi:GWxTD domain-containing protein
MRRLLSLLAICLFTRAASPGWLDLVAPIITAQEKKLYNKLAPSERPQFEEAFWTSRSITEPDYRQRLAYVDAKFGSTKFGSGANTDQGNVYLAVGPPNKITRFPSSRVFQPLEIWYYSTIRGLINTEVSLIFFKKNGMGLMKLYSPTTDTIRALLVPQSSTAHMFGPNDDLNEAEIRNNLKAGPAEDEIISACVNVAKSIRYEGNADLLGKISSPAYMLKLPQTTDVRSRIVFGHPRVETFQSRSLYGGSQVDFAIEVMAQDNLDMQVVQNGLTVYQNHLNLKFDQPTPLRYTHRLDLLAGSYRVNFNVDGVSFSNNIAVEDHLTIGNISRADASDVKAGHPLTPFSFDGKQLNLNADGKFAVVAVARPGSVRWTIRRGLGGVIWRSVSGANQIAVIELPALAAGPYQLEARAGEDETSLDFVVKESASLASDLNMLSFNANLHSAQRYAFIGHQWVLRGELEAARAALKTSIERGRTEEAILELARADALAGNLDAARDAVKSVLAVKPNDFEALSVFAYIETGFQDYAVAADLYRRALAVQDSPALRAALERLPVK